MYVDPKTGQLVLTHPAELKRIPGYRDHGFDELNPVHDWLTAALNENNWGAFYKHYSDAIVEDSVEGKVKKNAKNYIFIKCEANLEDDTPHYMVEIEAGYVDFQDGEKMPVSNINLIYFKQSGLLTLQSAASYGLITEDVFRPLSDLVDGPYLKLS